MHNPFNDNPTILGRTVGRQPGKSFGILQRDRLSHMFILGQTGTGKSTLLSNMARQDLEQGIGFCLIDPHGDLATELAVHLPENGIFWDFADDDCEVGYNPLTFVAEKYRHRVAAGIIDALKTQWSDAWGVRMEHLLRFALLALLSRPGSTLVDIVPMFTNKAFRSKVLTSVSDPEVQNFWTDEFPKMNYKNAFDGVAPIANKLGALLANPMARRSLCCPNQPLRFRRLMDEGTPLIVNLSKGKVGSGISEVVGGLILAMIANAALTREDAHPSRRRPYNVYVDEFATFTTDTIAEMLSELRKYRVGLVLSGQYLAGVTTKIAEAIFGNAGTLVAFRIGVTDSGLVSRQLGIINPEDLINLPNFRVLMRLMIRGTTTKAFSAKTLLVEDFDLNKLTVG